MSGFPRQRPRASGGSGDSAAADQQFEWSDFLLFDEGSEEDSASPMIGETSGLDNFADQGHNINSGNETRRIGVEAGVRVAFRTKTALDVLDDGFKWRKYGKKSVKNSPNPRNYYRCSRGGCPVKKRVERDRDDPTYVITTYEGMHNHESPCVSYCPSRHGLDGASPSERAPTGGADPWNLQTRHGPGLSHDLPSKHSVI